MRHRLPPGLPHVFGKLLDTFGTILGHVEQVDGVLQERITLFLFTLLFKRLFLNKCVLNYENIKKINLMIWVHGDSFERVVAIVHLVAVWQLHVGGEGAGVWSEYLPVSESLLRDPRLFAQFRRGALRVHLELELVAGKKLVAQRTCLLAVVYVYYVHALDWFDWRSWACRRYGTFFHVSKC